MTEMNVLFYTGSKGEAGERLYSLADTVSLSARTRVFRSIDDLSRMLSQSAYDGPTVAVLLADDKDDLENLRSIRHQLSDIDFILILPDRQANTTRMGYSLAPRFLTSVEDNLDEVADILSKMAEKHFKKEIV
ncbi:MAG: hypothetical protein JRJ65_14675 [Deltaproteobacteria bacterium]|nr:hypothetical protein [Deltaproteobacteria bacterium]